MDLLKTADLSGFFYLINNLINKAEKVAEN